MHRTMLAALGCCLALASLALATDRDKDKDDADQVTDAQFVMKASRDGLAEVNHGMLAARKASDPDVRAFAQRMVRDHGTANRQLLALADRKQLRVARDMGEKHQEMQDKLGRLSGAAFDRAYLHHMVEGHEKAVALFKAEAEHGKDRDLKAFAEKTLPTVEDHLKAARRLHDRLHDKGKDKDKQESK